MIAGMFSVFIDLAILILSFSFSNLGAVAPPSPCAAAAVSPPQSNGSVSSAGGAGNVSSVRTVSSNLMQDDEVARWAARLPRARVSRWGGMISTPDAVLQVNTYFHKLREFMSLSLLRGDGVLRK